MLSLTSLFVLENMLAIACYIAGLFIMLRAVAIARRAASRLSRLVAVAAILAVIGSQATGWLLCMGVALAASSGLVVLSGFLARRTNHAFTHGWDV